MDTHNNLHSFCHGHYNHVLHIGIHDMDALDLQEKLFFPPISLLLKFICELRQTWILVIISILFSIRHYNHVHLFGIHDIDALIWQEMHFLSTIFLIIKVHPSNETKLDTCNNLHSFCYRHYNQVLLIKIPDIDALVQQEKVFFPSFFL